MNKITEKFYNQKLIIEDILANDECIIDITTNQNTKFKKLISTTNIISLIRLCLKPNESEKVNSQKSLRYAYYSCQLLCSQNFLLFSKSIKNIKESNLFQNNSQNFMKNGNCNNLNCNNLLSLGIDKRNDNLMIIKKPEINLFNLNKDDISKKSIDESINIKNDEVSHSMKNELPDYVQYRYSKIKNTSTKIDFQKDENPKIMNTKYGKEEMDIINEILKEIFSVLHSETYENQTCLGYFQKIVNYLLYYESEVIIDFLFKDSPPIIYNLYNHLNNASIQNILENLLNILSDYEDDYEDFNLDQSKYIQTIYNLLNQLKCDEKFEKAEFICDLIIRTLINNSDKHLIALIFNDKNSTIMESIRDIMEKTIKKENNYKMIIPIIQLLCQLNNCLINSLNYSHSEQNQSSYLESPINENFKLYQFEHQYCRKKKISSSNIAKAFKSNVIKYLTFINEIYKLLAKDIKTKWENNIQNKFRNNKDANGIYKAFGLKNLYEWKYILSSIKLYIYSFYKTDIHKNGHHHYFLDEKLFMISMELYLYYTENNIYQNIFLEIIKLICDKKCPKYLIKPFLKLEGIKEEGNFIHIILNKIHKLKELNICGKKNNKKKNMSIGQNFEILNYFYSSLNEKILSHFDKYKLDKKYKIIFLDTIKPKIGRKIGENYQYSDNENNIKREFPTADKIIELFSNKCKKEENLSIISNNNIIKNKMILNNNISKDILRIKNTQDFDNNKIIEIKKITEFIKEDNEEIKMEVKFTIKDKNDEDNSNEEIEHNEIKPSI